MTSPARLPTHKTPAYKLPDFAQGWPITTLSNGWGVCVARIGPEVATEMLALNHQNQRNFVTSSIAKFAKDMSEGNWRLTHQGVAFNRWGLLHDGQNRLTAIVESGAAVDMLVFFGAGDKEEMVVIDTGKNRTVVDAAHVIGLRPDKSVVATINNCLKFARKNRNYNNTFTQTDQVRLVEKYGEQARTIAAWFSRTNAKGTDRAPIKAAVLAAYLTGTDADTLERFVGVLCDKIPNTEPQDSGPHLLRSFVNKHVGMSSGMMVSTDLYLRTCQALLWTIEGTPVKVLRACDKSPFIIEENAGHQE